MSENWMGARQGFQMLLCYYMFEKIFRETVSSFIHLMLVFDQLLPSCVWEG